jgi:hypothetical protein
VAIIGAIGGFLLLGGMFAFLTMAFAAWTGEPLYALGPLRYPRAGLFFGVWGICCGSSLIASAILWWKNRWWVAVAIIGACFVVAKILSAAGIAPD